jgi:hypothetical protein
MVYLGCGIPPLPEELGKDGAPGVSLNSIGIPPIPQKEAEWMGHGSLQ